VHSTSDNGRRDWEIMGEDMAGGNSGYLECVYTLRLAFCKIRGAGIRNLFYTVIFHSLAGAVTGSVFKVRTLLLLLIFVLIEAAILAVMDIRIAGFWALANVSMVQIGYVAGLYARGVLEQAGYLLPPARINRP
jgi:hypothetical protein